MVVTLRKEVMPPMNAETWLERVRRALFAAVAGICVSAGAWVGWSTEVAVRDAEQARMQLVAVPPAPSCMPSSKFELAEDWQLPALPSRPIYIYSGTAVIERPSLFR